MRINQIGDILVPVFLQWMIANLTIILFGMNLNAAWQTTLAAVFTIPAAWTLMRRDGQRIAAEKGMIPVWSYPLAVVLGVLFNLLYADLLVYLKVTESFSNGVQEKLLASDILVQVIGLGLLVPVAEEMIFRGLVYQRMRKYLSVRSAIILAAAVFALYHGNMVQILFAFPMAIPILLFYEKWNSLVIPILFHMAVNLSTVICTYIR